MHNRYFRLTPHSTVRASRPSGHGAGYTRHRGLRRRSTNRRAAASACRSVGKLVHSGNVVPVLSSAAQREQVRCSPHLGDSEFIPEYRLFARTYTDSPPWDGCCLTAKRRLRNRNTNS